MLVLWGPSLENYLSINHLSTFKSIILALFNINHTLFNDINACIENIKLNIIEQKPKKHIYIYFFFI